MGTAHGRLDPASSDWNRFVCRWADRPDRVAVRPIERSAGLCDLREGRREPSRADRVDRPHMELFPASSVRHPASGDGHRQGIRARDQQDIRDPDDRRLGGADGSAVGLLSGSGEMSIGDSSTPLGKVRGLGSAQHGGGHWLTERVTSIALLLLGAWLIASLLLLPKLDQRTLIEWLHAPTGAIPMALLVVIGFKHALDGMKVFIDDYVHEPGNNFR